MLTLSIMIVQCSTNMQMYTMYNVYMYFCYMVQISKARCLIVQSFIIQCVAPLDHHNIPQQLEYQNLVPFQTFSPFSNWLKPSWKKTQFESDKIITSVNQWYWFNIQLYDYYLLAGMVVMPSCPKCSLRRLHSKLLKQRLSKPKWLWKDENTMLIFNKNYFFV